MRRWTPTPRLRPIVLATAVLLGLGSAACGVEVSASGGGGSDPTDPSTTIPVPCAPEPPSDDDGGGDTGGSVGGGGDATEPDCVPEPSPTTEPTPTTEPEDPTTTTTTTTEPDEPDPDPGDEQAYVDAIADSIAGGDTGDLRLTDEQAGCLAPGWLDAIGLTALVDAGIEPEDLRSGDLADDLQELLDRDQAAEMVASFDRCGVDLDELFLNSLVADGERPEEEIRCLVDALPEGYVDELLTISLADGDEALDEDPALAETLTDAYARCVD